MERSTRRAEDYLIRKSKITKARTGELDSEAESDVVVRGTSHIAMESRDGR